MNNNQSDRQVFWDEAFSRNIGLISKEEQSKIANSRVAIAGLGGVGGAYCLALARTGFGKFIIADFDRFEKANFNRQSGANMDTVGKEKSLVMEEMIKKINPYAEVKVFSQGIKEENMDDFFSGADVVLDGLDFFAIRERIVFYQKAREKGLVVLNAAPIGFGTSVLIFGPKKMSFKNYFNIREDENNNDNIVKFGIGICPKMVQSSYVETKKFDIFNHSMPSLYGGISSCVSAITAMAVKVVLGKKIKFAPYSYQFDPYVGKIKKTYLWRGNRNIIQKLKIYYVQKFLLKK